MYSYFLFLLFAQVASESVHWQWREMICISKGNKLSKDSNDCDMFLHESDYDPILRKAPLDPCFQETVNGTVRQYCDVLCPNADTVYLIKRSPSNHRSCFGQISYKIEKRGTNFYMTRDGKCRTSAVEFQIRCEFLFGRQQFPPDEKIFAEARKSLNSLSHSTSK